MAIPDKTAPQWGGLIKGSLNPNLEFLGLKILLNRLQRKYRQDPQNLNLQIEELRNFFEKNQTLPKTQRDFKTIFGRDIT